MSSFTPYPCAQKVKGRRDFRMVSNVSARKKWLIKHVPEWEGPEIWSEKRVKKYIYNVKNLKPLPLAKRVKIPWGWDCRRIPTFVSVVTESETDSELEWHTEWDTESDSETETDLHPMFSFNNYLNAMVGFRI